MKQLGKVLQLTFLRHLFGVLDIFGCLLGFAGVLFVFWLAYNYGGFLLSLFWIIVLCVGFWIFLSWLLKKPSKYKSGGKSVEMINEDIKESRRRIGEPVDLSGRGRWK